MQSEVVVDPFHCPFLIQLTFVCCRFQRYRLEIYIVIVGSRPFSPSVGHEGNDLLVGGSF